MHFLKNADIIEIEPRIVGHEEKMQNFDAGSSEYVTPEVNELGMVDEIVARFQVGLATDSLSLTS